MTRVLTWLFVSVLAFTAVGAVRAADTERFEGSLLFSAPELEEIRAAVAERPESGGRNVWGPVNPETAAETTPLWSIERLRLSALIFYDTRRWTLWLGKTRVEPGNLPPYIRDVRVTQAHADLSVIRRPGAQPIPIRLRPNQTFLVSDRRIVDGLSGAGR